MSDTERRGKLKVAATIASVVAIITVWMNFPELQHPFCLGKTEQLFQRTGWCADKWQRVSEEDATRTLDKYLALAGGPKPTDAWPLLSGSERDRVTRQEFVGAWTDVARAERIAPVKADPNSLNWFKVDYRLYRVTAKDRKGLPVWTASKGPVDERRLEVKVQRTPEGLRIFETGDNSRVGNAGRVRAYAWATFASNTVTYRDPSEDALVAAPDVRAGSGLRVLCELPTSHGSWYASYLGWFPAHIVRLSAAPSGGVIRCSSFGIQSSR